ncbi:MAG: MBL-fold metallo-hydrolase superfamily [uncultured Solirubrobacteraceae bacterium]|uniref:MBL-fold metallo-hydrolase superfamily n=1 Tax=uncultured Solirubrobacteraceae bacterium TaxID=1162706 RepID=A0A6J4SPW0_9ACTN|nr:MAG: MBL-fold metallo-hydrolase superfamily [uncultured Solirubrobacteraceae bacterium]
MALRLTTIAPGVHRLATRYTNWYVLEEGGRLTVLDAGLPGDWRRANAALAGLGYALSDVDAVLITHHHPDHAGNAERFRAAGATVHAHPADAPAVRGDRGGVRLKQRLPFLRQRWYRIYMLHVLANGVTRVPAVAELDHLADGEVLDVPGSPRVVHAPGHTPGSCAVLLEGRSLLFSGDALVTLDMTEGKRGPQVIRGPDTDDAELALQSLDVLAATRAETVLPGHGEPWTQGVEEAVAIARRGA